jgi:glycosyltransferase involved in cell wall biosynthesis
VCKRAVSVIMPVYNGEEYLHEAVDSILNQTFTDFELLVVNDLSTDRTVEIVREYQKRDPRVKLYENCRGKGIVGALNTGLEAAGGAYIARADADDINRPYRLREQFDFLQRNRSKYLVGGGYAPFSERGRRADVFHPKRSIEIAWRFISDTFFCHPTVMIRREVYDEIGGYPNTAAEDYAYFSRIVRKYEGYNIDKVLIDYREHGSRLSEVNSERIAESVRATSEDNFRYYMGTLDHYEELWRFQHGAILSLGDVKSLVKVNIEILNRIRKQYNVPVCDLEFILMNIKLIIRCLGQVGLFGISGTVLRRYLRL